MAKVSGLGRGLGSLIPNKKVAEEAVSPQNKDILPDFDQAKIIKAPLDRIEVNPLQPRQIFDHEDLEELIESIKVHGIIQPLIVTRRGDKYQLIAGERRFRSAKILELPTVPVIVREADQQEKLELALIENVQRKNLNPVETAVAYQRFIDEFNLTQEQIAEKMGKSRSSVANNLRFLTLPEEIQRALATGKITEGHAKIIAGLDTEKKQLDFLKKILNKNLTVRDAEHNSRALKKTITRRVTVKDPSLDEKEALIRAALNTKVSIKKNGNRGKIEIDFYSEEEMNQIISDIVK